MGEPQINSRGERLERGRIDTFDGLPGHEVLTT
jgi:hypothetical protein